MSTSSQNPSPESPTSARERLIGYALVALPNEPAFAKCDELANAFRAEVLHEAIKAARSKLLTDGTGADVLVAYDRGINDAVVAISALLEGGAS
ncbi:hypothetical protein [Streptomyces sp. 4R-3d]|uniref:hypothetical protein n=1 Tax=Streptomyces sp. 4R-3d TaxID=2559605 RepID=UPI001071EA62|nr:hypothetical protein [Streptomyces sp. 4R-3d]TFI30087.1 hypothetical protein E4P36_04885 [Streptomyces sp. 4R-3d]